MASFEGSFKGSFKGSVKVPVRVPLRDLLTSFKGTLKRASAIFRKLLKCVIMITFVRCF